MSAIVLELDSALSGLLPADAIDAHVVDKKSFDGGEVLQVLATISVASLPWITTVVVTAIRAKKHVVIRHKGREIRGVSADEAVKILRELADD
ncbi:hypothetical protein [Stenotrophomonas rhizophila]|uniref:hypothetical protein n=1 Tax=Stenotrophomonas rhizophila TaxID=216778 RepID=UPI0011A6743E|nr:hypothetical protein [Stenotrophomonas rhizophila]